MSKEGVKCPVSLQRSRLKDTRRENNLWTGRLLSVSDCRRGWSAAECSQSSLTPTVFRYLFHSRTHWRQPRRGCRGHIPPIFWLGGRQREYPRQYYYVLLDIADQYWLPSVRSASSRFHSAIRRHQFASVRQADSRLTRLVPPTLNSR